VFQGLPTLIVVGCPCQKAVIVHLMITVARTHSTHGGSEEGREVRREVGLQRGGSKVAARWQHGWQQDGSRVAAGWQQGGSNSITQDMHDI